MDKNISENDLKLLTEQMVFIIEEWGKYKNDFEKVKNKSNNVEEELKEFDAIRANLRKKTEDHEKRLKELK